MFLIFLIFFFINKWKVILNCLKNFEKTIKISYKNKENIYYDETDDPSIIGGYNNFRSFKGFISSFLVYRRHVVDLRDLKMPNSFSQSHLKQYESICSRYMEQFIFFEKYINYLLEKIIRKSISVFILFHERKSYLL